MKLKEQIDNSEELAELESLLKLKKEEEFYYNLIDIVQKQRNNLHFENNLLNENLDIQLRLQQINDKLSLNSYFIGQAFTLGIWRKKNTKLLKVPVIGFLFKLYTFLTRRVFSRLYFFKGLRKVLFSKSNTLISKAEILGRLAHAGFEIVDFQELNDRIIFLSKKTSTPMLTKVKSGVFISLNRVGKNGKIFKVYKLRTMHPYAEFIHDFMIKNHGFAETGKISDDFRLTKWAKILRKYWLDEFPQLLNLLKGEMKLVGPRPVSTTYFNLLDENLKNTRTKIKPGCIPPYVCLNMKSSKEDVLKAENIYLNNYNKKPFRTDIVYLVKALINIVFNGKRSY